VSHTFEINGQLVTLTDSEKRAMLRQLVNFSKRNVWPNISGSLRHMYGRWEWHYNERNNPVHWVMEVAGGANLPTATTARSLMREHDRLDRQISASGIVSFYGRLDTFQRNAAGFRSIMRNYLNSFDLGGGRVIRLVRITQDGSFLTLQVCAALLTAGASTAVLATAEGAATALARSAATSFVINEMKNSSNRLGRTLAGERITTQDTLREVGDNALSSVSDSLLGEIVGHFLSPLKDLLKAAVTQEIRSGRLASGVAIEVGGNRIENAITDTISNLRPSDLRSALRDVPQAGSQRECARSTSRHLMANRNFRRDLVRRLQDR
jgi:hypothetical protein